jgi:hypothetical protein
VRETKQRLVRCFQQENSAMMIYMLAAAMTLAMLVATAFSLHQEAHRVRTKVQTARVQLPGWRNRRAPR